MYRLVNLYVYGELVPLNDIVSCGYVTKFNDFTLGKWNNDYSTIEVVYTDGRVIEYDQGEFYFTEGENKC